MSPRRYAKRDPDSRAPRSMSIRSPASSRWSLPSRPASPTSRIVVSSSGADGSGRLGSVTRIACRRSSAARVSSTRSFTVADSSFTRASASAASWPRAFAAPIASEACFCSARSDSAAAVAARHTSSAASSSSMRAARSGDRRASALLTASGSWRVARGARPIAGQAFGETPFGGPPLGSLGAGVLREELGHGLGFLPDHDVLGHDRAREAAVADRVENLVDLFLARVEVRAVDALAVAHLRRRALGAHLVERVTARAALGEQPRALGGRVALGHADPPRPAGAQRRDRGQGEDDCQRAPGHWRRSLYGSMRRAMSRFCALLATVGAAAAAAGCGGEPAAVTVPGTTLRATLDEYRITPQNVRMKAGRIHLT